jgi:DNA replication protein DnaC
MCSQTICQSGSFALESVAGLAWNTHDWGLEPLKLAHRNDLMEIMDDRHGQTSTLVISQLPTDQWYTSIGDNTLADAILDRLMHNAHRLPLKGESMRKILGQLTEDEHLS